MSEQTEPDSKQLESERKRANRLNNIKNRLESGQTKSFEQIFDIITQTRMSIELEIPYYAFLKKARDPREFTLNEIMRFAALIGVERDVIAAFL